MKEREKQDIEYDIDERYDEGGVEEVSKPKFDYKNFLESGRRTIGIAFYLRKRKVNGGGLDKNTREFMKQIYARKF